MARFRTQLLEEGEAPPLELLLQHLPPACRPFLLDASDGSGASVLLWSPDRLSEGQLRPGEGGRHGWPLADRDPLDELAAVFAEEQWESDPGVPFPACGWFGWLGFECAHAWEAWPWAVPDPGSFPDWSFARYRMAVVRNPEGGFQFCWAESQDDPSDARQQALLVWHQLLAATHESVSAWPSNVQPLEETICLQASVTPAAYQEQVSQLRKQIAEGELFQANLSHILQSPAPSNGRAFFRQIRAQQPTSFSAYWEDSEGRSLLSWSPECFLRVEKESVWTRPIKGTAPRGKNPSEDASLALALDSSEKEKAELTMIVDMARNDLGRIAKPGGVETLSVGQVQEWPTLQHRIASIRAQRDPKHDFASLMRATFPPASVTGAPKIRALQSIVELEGVPRGPYCGALGHWLPGVEQGEFSVLIRSATLAEEQLQVHVGAGIVWDSDPELEWQETLLKAQYLAVPIASEKA